MTIEAPSYDLGEPWSSSVRITTRRPYAGTPQGLQVRHLHIAHAGNYDRVLESVIEGRWVNVVQAQGGQFLIGHSDTCEQGLALWRGPWHEAATWLPDPQMPGSHALRYLDRLWFEDNPNGLSIRPASEAVNTVEVLEVSKRVPDVGYLDIRRPATAHQLVPAWSGARVPTGEVWREETSPNPDQASDVVLIHATPTTVTTIAGHRDQKHRYEERVEFLNQLTELSWTEAESRHGNKSATPHRKGSDHAS